MAPSLLDKALIGVAGTGATGILAWQVKFPWIKYDIQMMQLRKKLIRGQEDLMRDGFLIDKFESHVANHPQKAMLIFEDCVYTYEFINQQANKVAHMARFQLGLKFGDTVAMMVHNEPSFIWTMLGFQKMGVAVALINYNLRLKPLVHCVLATQPKSFIVGTGEDLLVAVSDVADDLQGVPVYVQGLSGSPVPADMADWDCLMTRALPVQPDPSVRSQMTCDSIAAFYYTSGTTGLPKPVYARQRKVNFLACILSTVDLTSDDVLYTAIPLHHVAGGGFGFYSSLNKGCTMVLRRKFSVSHFWEDCRRHNVTVVLHIGEIYRYILALPKDDLDTAHKVRASFGNGVRRDIFEEIRRRYQIGLVCEAFGATEGVSINFNIANKPGAVGRLSPWLTLTDPNPSVLVKFDPSTAMPLRDGHGRCVRVKPGEIGLYLSQVPEENLIDGELEVYRASKDANEKKLVRNAFKEGDLYFNYGDVLYLDRDYFLYFYDRLGDTFRWKGENVSTTEVSNVMSTLDFVNDVNVYGVEIPGHNGRAGMAALTLNEGEKITPERLKRVYKMCQDNLPSYARPLFLRILPEALLTATFKQSKTELMQQGYDSGKVKDDLYFLDSKAKTYSRLTSEGLVSFLQSRL